MNSIKIFKITNHAVIGFVGGGVGIADEEFKGFADDINNRLRGRDTLTHDEIAREAVTYLESRSDKLTDSVGLSGLIAAYDYRLGKPENPRLITMQRKDGSFGYHIERDKYSAIDEKSKGFIVNRSQFYFESVYTIRSLTYNQAKNAMLELMKFVRENAQYGYFIGGEVNVWRITEEGIYMEPNIFKFVDSEKLKEGTQIKVPSP